MKRLSMMVSLVLLFILVPLLSSAQQSPQATPPASSATPPEGGADDPAHTGHDQTSDGQAGGKHDQFKAEWKAMDERMNSKISQMNAAKGEKRLEAMAAVINEMADQRTQMREMFMSTHGKECPQMGGGGRGGMMGGRGGMMRGKGGMMGGHGGQDGGSSGGCPNCPMMQGHGSGGQGVHSGHGQTGASGGQEQKSSSQ